jgi:Ion transport protein
MTNFDNIFSSLIQVLLIVTLDSWSYIMYQLQRGFSNYIWWYFVSLIFFGSFVLNNLLLAIIKSKFSEGHSFLSQKKEIPGLFEEKPIWDFSKIKRDGLWINGRKSLDEESSRIQ